MTGYAVLCEERKKKVNKNKTAIEEFASSINEVDKARADSVKLELEFYHALEEESEYDLE